MAEETSAETVGNGRRDEPVDLAAIAAALLRRWRLVGGIAAAAVVLGLAVSLLRPAVYRTSTVLFINDEGGQSAQQMLAARLPAGLLGGAAGGPGAETRMVNLVLDSRTLADSLKSRFGASHELTVERQANGAISLLVEDPDPRRAVALADEYPQIVNEMIGALEAQGRERREQVLRAQLEEAREQLEAVERRAMEFQLEAGGPAVQEQAAASLTAAIDLQRMIGEQEILVQRLRRTATPNNPELQAAVAELATRRAQLRELMTQGAGERLLPSFQESPELQIRGQRLLRDLARAQEIYGSSSAALASLQISGDDALPALIVLDEPILPREPAPRRPWLFGLAALVAGLIIGSGAALAAEFTSDARDDPRRRVLVEAWAAFRSDLRSSLPGVRRGRRDSAAEVGGDGKRGAEV